MSRLHGFVKIIVFESIILLQSFPCCLPWTWLIRVELRYFLHAQPAHYKHCPLQVHNIVHEINNCKPFQTRCIRYKISHCLYDWLKRSFFRGGKLSASSSCVFPSLSLVETGALQLWQCDFCETHRKRSGKEVITQLQISHSSNKSSLQPHLFIFHCFDVTTYLTISWTMYKTYSYK